MLLKLLIAIPLIAGMSVIAVKVYKNEDKRYYYKSYGSKVITDSSCGKIFFHVQSKLGL